MLNNCCLPKSSLRVSAILACLLMIGCSSEKEPQASSGSSSANRPVGDTTQVSTPEAAVSGTPEGKVASGVSSAKKSRAGRKTGTVSSMIDDPSLYGGTEPPKVSRGMGKK